MKSLPMADVALLRLTFCSYKKLAIFTTNVDAESQTLINHKCVCGALNRQFLVGAVTCCAIFCLAVQQVFFCRTVTARKTSNKFFATINAIHSVT
jgi:hypothetical protein